MAGYYGYTAVLDACVLYPAPIRDLLLSLASEGIFRARWTHLIMDEWTRNLLTNRPDITQEKLNHTIKAMNGAIDDCFVKDFEYLIDSLTLPDLDDRHVLAAAIVGHADAIVTYNLVDFPEEITLKRGIEILHPDDFFIAQYDLDPIQFLKIVKALRSRLKNPLLSAKELITKYEALNLPQLSKLLINAVELI